jgi:hypothetical protein
VAGTVARGVFSLMQAGDVQRWAGYAQLIRFVSWPRLEFTDEAVGARFVFLRAYSPKLNPCEFVFVHVKNWLRRNPVAAAMLLLQRLTTSLREVTVGDCSCPTSTARASIPPSWPARTEPSR